MAGEGRYLVVVVGGDWKTDGAGDADGGRAIDAVVRRYTVRLGARVVFLQRHTTCAS